jgi:hypothetical protein
MANAPGTTDTKRTAKRSKTRIRGAATPGPGFDPVEVVRRNLGGVTYKKGRGVGHPPADRRFGDAWPVEAAIVGALLEQEVERFNAAAGRAATLAGATLEAAKAGNDRIEENNARLKAAFAAFEHRG